jgi:hypothetical protein
MEARNASFAGSRGFPKQALPAFEHKLEQLALESGGPVLFPNFLREQLQNFFFSRFPLKLATFVGCLLLMVLVFLRLTSAPPVSAKEILYRVKQAEAKQLQQTPLPVVYEKLRLRRSSSSDHSDVVTWEIWRDTRSKRFRHRVADSQGPRILPVNNREQVEFELGENRPSGSLASQNAGEIKQVVPAAFAELEQVFRSHRANFEDPLSPDSFETWCQAIHDRHEEGSQGRLASDDEAFVLRSSGHGPFAENSIMSAELTVRKRDWQPVEQRLQVKTVDGTANYTLEKVAFEVIAFNLVPPSIFAEPALPVTMLRVAAPSAAVPAKEEPLTESDLIAAEVEAWYSLHSVGACLGRPMSVVRAGPGGVEVQGIVEKEEVKTQIATALQGIPHVTFRIRTVVEDEVANSIQTASPQPVATVEATPAPTAEGLPQKLAAEGLLEQFFASEDCAAGAVEEKGNCIQQKIAQLSQEVLLSSEAALAQAWALRLLGERYSLVQQDDLRISSRRLMELMVRDHLMALRQEWQRSQSLVKPVLGLFLKNLSLSSEQREPEPVAGTTAESGGLVAASHGLRSAVARTTNLMLGMFVETNIPVTDMERAAGELLSAMATLDGAIVELDAEVASEFSGASKVATKDKSERE